MGSLRPSMRSKASGPIGPHIPNGHTANASAQIGRKEELSVFESESFDADSYVQARCQSMSEKGIRKLCAELLELKKHSAEEMRRSVYANYSAFIRTSRELSGLEGELMSVRNILTTEAAIIHQLADMRLPSIANENVSSDARHDVYLEDEDTETSRLQRETESLPDLIDVYIAERKISDALDALDRGDELVTSLKAAEMSDETVSALKGALAERRVALAELLTGFSKQPSIGTAELRAIIAALDRLGDGPQAHTLLLSAYHERLKHYIQVLRPSGASFGGAYTAALSQLVFSHIARAARDSVKVFGDQPAYASELILWARDEVKTFSEMIKKYVLSASAASGGLRAAADCVQIAFGYCSLLESHGGLALCPVLTKLVRPSVEQALDASFRRIEDSVSVLAAADDWVPRQPPPRAGFRSGTLFHYPSYLRLTSSAYHFSSMMQEFLDDVTPLSNMQLTSSPLDGVARLFEAYVHLLMRAMPAAGDEETLQITDTLCIKIAETDTDKLALLGNAAALADELLPLAVARLHHITEDRRAEKQPGARSEHREFRRRIQRAVEKLRDRFCEQHALGLIYTEDGTELSASLYLDLDSNSEDYPWHADAMPSPVFQALFQKFKSISSAGAEVMPRRERVLTLLLLRLVEFVLMLLSSDQDFWEEIEGNELGSKGLQQLLLDMHFALQMAGQMNHSSLRHLNELVNDIISRAVDAFAASGQDPESVLPDTNWFVSAAQDAIEKLSSDWVKEPLSPAASVSAHSVSSSIRSLGSP